MPTSASLVTNLPADFNTFGQAVDTSMAQLKGGTTGQILSKTSATDMAFTWIANDQGDLTAITAGSGIAVTSGTGPVPSVALDLTAANVFTAAQTATRFIVTGSTIATNGMYLPAANTLGFSTNSTVRMQINANGELGLGTAPATGYAINAGINATGATDAGFMQVTQQVNSDVTATWRGVWSKPSTQAAAFTITNVRHFQVEGAGIGAGSTVTTQVGFFVQTNVTGATNNYGFQGQIASGTNRYNLYMSGTASNYLLGRTGVGVALTTTAQFQVTNSQSATDVTAIFRSFAAQTADTIKIQNSAGTDVYSITPAGLMKYISGNTATTVGAAGVASALPATPTGYLKIDIGGTEFKVPYYAA